MPRRSVHRGESGFTLLELLVVLVLLSFITTLLIQGMTYVAKVNDTFAREGHQRYLRELAFGWFSDAISQLAAPEQGETGERFRGDPLSFEAVTLSSVDRREGIPTPFAFRLEPEGPAAELIYVRRVEASRWPLLAIAADARFEYLDGQGRWHEDWPPVPELADALPDAVAVASEQERLFLMAPVQMPRRGLALDDR
ncbi:prepilin-type N-terminal cleavage/methylation domain-containing protein [Pseudomonas sp. MT3]